MDRWSLCGVVFRSTCHCSYLNFVIILERINVWIKNLHIRDLLIMEGRNNREEEGKRACIKVTNGFVNNMG